MVLSAYSKKWPEREQNSIRVRTIHVPAGISAACTEERSQYRNKQLAFARIQEQLEKMQDAETARQKNATWREHTRIIRGNPVRTYRGIDFILAK